MVAVAPGMAERCVVRLSGERAQKRVAHWQAVVVSACEQCGRNTVPEVRPLLGLREWLADLAADAGLRLLLAPQAVLRPRELERSASGATLLAGPEGGFSESESADALRAGFLALRLGPRVLRTETAAVAALAVLQAQWGDF